MRDPFRAWMDFSIDGQDVGRMVSLRRLGADLPRVAGLPASLRIILESVVRNLGHGGINDQHVRRIADWRPSATAREEVPFRVARVLLQDISGIPVLMDMDAMRHAMRRCGVDPRRLDTAVPVSLVVDHSIQAERAGSTDAHDFNRRVEFSRNRERFAFLKWAGQAFGNLEVLPPGSGIVHQVNLEYLAPGILSNGDVWFPDTLLGTDSHTTMTNALGVVGWGVGGIEALAAVLGEPVPLALPDVVGVRLDGRLREGATATDLVLSVTARLRREKVVGQFVEFYGAGARSLSVPDRATVSNMAPEFGASLAYFAPDDQTAAYFLATGRRPADVVRWQSYLAQQDLYGIPERAACTYSRELVMDLADIEPCIAGPSRPQQQIRLAEAAQSFRRIVAGNRPATSGDAHSPSPVRDGDILIAAITSCTNTANPAMMVAAGLLARKAVERGLRVGENVKTSLAPGSLAVTAYLERAGLREPLERLGFHVVAYGCTTCMGGSGALNGRLEDELAGSNTIAVAVLSGNRNFEGRIHPRIRANYLMSPPLVVAYALAGNIGIDLTSEPLGQDDKGRPVHLRELWPDSHEIAGALAAATDGDIYARTYRSLEAANPQWRDLEATTGPTYRGDPGSTYILEPPFLDGFDIAVPAKRPIHDARALGILGSSITTDHISPVGRIAPDSPAGVYLAEKGVAQADLNTYGARRGNHEVMLRGMFAHDRLLNRMAGREGNRAVHHPSGATGTFYEVAMRYRAEGVPTLIFAGDEYGTGSSRDWAAKGLMLLGVRAVIAEGFERIHRSNLVGMGIAPCQLPAGTGLESLALTGRETFDVAFDGDDGARASGALTIHRADGRVETIPLVVRIDSETERDYVRNGGILPYLLRRQLGGSTRAEGGRA